MTGRIPASRRLLVLLALMLALSSLLWAPRVAVAATTSAGLALGDSYTEGVADDDLSDGKGWAPVAGQILNAKVTVDGRGGSGYLNPTGYCSCRFDRRVGQHSDVYRWVVLQGSTNDQAYISKDPVTGRWDTAAYAGRVNATLKAAKLRYPHAVIVVVGPVSPYGSPSEKTRKINEKLRAAAWAADLPFVDGIAEEWFKPGDGAKYANNDPNDPGKGHPNGLGYKLIGQRIASHVGNLT